MKDGVEARSRGIPQPHCSIYRHGENVLAAARKLRPGNLLSMLERVQRVSLQIPKYSRVIP